MSFWSELQNKHKQTGVPFFCVAPMADVTDVAFRELIATYSRTGQVGGGPDVFWTEFVSANGLAHTTGREVLTRDLAYTENQRPIVAQIFSSDPTTIESAAYYCAGLGFDGVDINMGCPDKTIEKQGAGASMIKTPEIAGSVIAAAKAGIARYAQEHNTNPIALSVKTRIGYQSIDMDWISFLLQQNLETLTIHVRTRKEMSDTVADWSRLQQVVKLRNKIAPQTILIGNGDVISLQDGKTKAALAGVDGVMVGRALFGNPWFFDSQREMVSTIPKKQKSFFTKFKFLQKFFETKRTLPQSTTTPITISERLDVLLEHTQLFEKELGDIKSFAIMKKHYKAYCTGYPGAKELRIKLMDAKNSSEIKVIIDLYKKDSNLL